MKELQIIEAALNKANTTGAFNLNESMTIGSSLVAIKNALEQQNAEIESLQKRLDAQAPKEEGKREMVKK